MAFLEVKDLCVNYGEASILYHINMHVEEGEVVCILGRNGVGKTTLLRGIMGLTPPWSGSVTYQGTQLVGLFPYQVALQGIGYAPQGRFIFPELTVADNLRLGTFISREKKASIPEEIFEYFPFLKKRMKEKGRKLSGGEQQMLAIARAIVSYPRLMILDEPSEGIQPSIVKKLVEIISNINKEKGTAILLVEQNLDFAFKLASRGYILEKGKVVAKGPVNKLSGDSVVRSFLTV